MMRSIRFRAVLSASCASVVLFAATPVVAQDATPETATKESAQTGGAEAEIVVTARRREESLQTVPVAVTAVTSDMLTERNIQTTIDLQKIVPGVVFSGAGTEANTTLTIRGQGKDVIGPGLPSVISYFNEVPLPGFGSSIPTYDITSVQVLKGPQGTLFGRNTTGGALLIYSQAPTDRFEGYGQVMVGDYGWHAFQGAVNLPITEGMALRVAGNIERRDGFTENLGVGADFDTLHNDAFRVSLRLQPFDFIENTFVYDYFIRSGPYIGVIPTQVASANPPYRNGQNYAGIVGAANAQLINDTFNCNTSVNCDVDLMVARQSQIGPRQVYSDVDAFDKTRLQGISNTTTIDLGAVTIKNIFGWRKTEVDQRGNTDGVPVPLINTALTRHEAQITDELQLSGSAFEDRLDFLVGGFYLKTRPTGSISLFSDFLRPPSIPLASWRLSTVGNTLYREESKAIFGNLTYSFGGGLEGLSATAAARYTWDSQGVCSVTLGGASTPLQSTAECRTYANRFDIDAKFEKLTWTFGLDYKINESFFTYVVARRGYRSGGSNPPLLGGALASLQFYQPQTVDDIEVGLKTNWRSGDFSGRVNIAAYRGIFNDLQRQIAGIPANLDGDNNSANDPASTALIINGAKARVQGIEIDGFIQPMRGLQFTFGGSLIDPKYLEFSNPPILNGVATSSGIFLNTPKTSFSLGARAELANIEGMTVTLSGDYYWTDGYRKGIVAAVPSYDLANLRLEVANIADQNLDVTLFVDNLFDKEYYINNSLSGPSPGTTTFSYGPPRMFGVRARFGFGS
ncbi:TonB-dependent receptor [Sphingomonas sp.]|uniref:TonB-dependent receptor n=1 Tax=Sphingomonas sp. TaxID=28214 RepID=UPI003F714FA5